MCERLPISGFVMPTSLPIAKARRSWRNPFLVALIILYAACALAMIDGIARDSSVADLIAPLTEPGL